MPHFALVIENPVAHVEAQVSRSIARNLPAALAAAQQEAARAKRAWTAADEVRVTNAVAREVRRLVGEPRQVGDLHTTADRECPDSGLNCENCGDPEHAETCAAAGHCPHCGTRHGIAYAALLANAGLSLREIQPPVDGETWDRTRRAFVKSK